MKRKRASQGTGRRKRRMKRSQKMSWEDDVYGVKREKEAAEDEDEEE